MFGILRLELEAFKFHFTSVWPPMSCANQVFTTSYSCGSAVSVHLSFLGVFYAAPETDDCWPPANQHHALAKSSSRPPRFPFLLISFNNHKQRTRHSKRCRLKKTRQCSELCKTYCPKFQPGGGHYHARAPVLVYLAAVSKTGAVE